jgi:hypothetical protein
MSMEIPETLNGLKCRPAADEGAAQEELQANGYTDGLPVIVPTPERVRRMVLAGGMAGELSLGQIGPLGGNATVDLVATCAVMAGCLPDYFPVVLATARALCDDRLDMHEVQATTHNLGPIVIVNGPARFDCGPFASGTGALGPGHRANATVGRAARLCLINIGGGRPGIGDMALIGHPGKFTYCLAEAEEDSPFLPLHARLGFRSEQSVVTLINVEAPHSVLCMITDDTEDTADRLLRQLAAAVGNPASNSAVNGAGDVVIILNPEHARVLKKAGLELAKAKEIILKYAVNPRGRLHGRDQRGKDPGELVGHTPGQLVVLVAGGGGVYSLVAPSWGRGPHGNKHVSAEVKYSEVCEIL